MHVPGSIRIDRIRVTPASVAEAAKVLGGIERERMVTFRNEARRNSFAVGRLSARRMLAAELGCSPLDVPLEVRDDGSVGIEGDAFHVSISHSGPHVATAVSPHPVGLDLEVIRPRPAMLYRFILHPDELSLIESVPGLDDERITLLWTIKESVLKGQRTGLRRSPKSLRIDPAGLPDSVVVSASDGTPWRVAIGRESDHIASVAWPVES